MTWGKRLSLSSAMWFLRRTVSRGFFLSGNSTRLRGADGHHCSQKCEPAICCWLPEYKAPKAKGPRTVITSLWPRA